jgi:hypothetical protein
MARTPTRLAGPEQLAGSAATIYTNPGSVTTVVRHIHFSNPSGGAVDVTLSIGSDAAAVRLFDGFSIPSDSVYEHFCYHVVEDSEVVQAFAGSAATIVITMSGDEYS